MDFQLRRPFVRAALVAFGLIGIALAACSGQSGSPNAITPADLGAGAAVRAPNGTALFIESSAFASRPRAIGTYDARAIVPAPSAWSMLPGALRVTFVPALRALRGPATGARVVVAYPPSQRTALIAGHALLFSITYARGVTVPYVTPGNLDVPGDRIGADLPAQLLDGATKMTVAVGENAVKYVMESPGPRYWDGKQWSTSGTISPNKSTVVLIHGIFSSVESAFPSASPRSTATPCPQKIADAGGFQQVFGYDYKFDEPPYYGADRFAQFLTKLSNSGVKSVTIEAHSYGTIISLATIPTVARAIKVDNLVTLGGPLPLRGTPLASKDNAWRMSMMLGLLDWYLGFPPSVVDRMFDSGMVASLNTGSTDLKNILYDIKAMGAPPKFVEVAGNKWICFIGSSHLCVFSEETLKPQLWDGSGVKLPWDGVVETIAAKSTDLPNPVAKEFPLSHIDLECDPDVISWVGQQVKASH